RRRSTVVWVSSSRRAASNRRAPGTVTNTRRGWRSFLAKAIEGYLSLHRSLGRGYRTVEWVLHSLDLVLARQFANGRIFTEPMFAAWSGQILRVSPRKDRLRVLCVRQLCLRLRRAPARSSAAESQSFP